MIFSFLSFLTERRNHTRNSAQNVSNLCRIPRVISPFGRNDKLCGYCKSKIFFSQILQILQIFSNLYNPHNLWQKNSASSRLCEIKFTNLCGDAQQCASTNLCHFVTLQLIHQQLRNNRRIHRPLRCINLIGNFVFGDG